MLRLSVNCFSPTLGVALLLLIAPLLGQSSEPDPGADLLMPLKLELKTALKTGLQRGPVHAINVCKDQAPDIASKLSVDGIRMGRASHRLRNPDNAPPDWVNEILQTYLVVDSTLAPETRELENGRRGYVEPIIVQPLCLACHGEQLTDEVAEELANTYPSDNATGFKAGDLRGVYWVEYPSTLKPQNEGE